MPPSVPVSLLTDAGSKLLAREALLSLSVLETHCSPNRRDRVGIVGIVVVQLSTVARVANANVVGIPGVRSPKQRNLQAPRSHVVCSLNGFVKVFRIISPIGFQHPFREILRGCCQFCPEFASIIGNLSLDVHRVDTGTERIQMSYGFFQK